MSFARNASPDAADRSNLEADAGNVAWRGLRGLRADPPGLAKSGARRNVFGAALEQSEQLFKGASRLGAATRPINLFYGLSQAGRALAAALDDSDRWQFRGHGIGWQLDSPALEECRVGDKGSRGALISVARFLGSPSFPEGASLGRILCAVPELPIDYTPIHTHLRPLTILMSPDFPGSLSALTARVGNVPDEWVAGGHLDEAERKAEIIRAIQENYPSLAGSQLPQQGPIPLEWINGQYTLRLFWLTESPLVGEEQGRFVAAKGAWYLNDLYAFPMFPNSAQLHHPLVLWWAALWSLSMIARYEPSKWASLLRRG